MEGPALRALSTEELLEKVIQSGIDVSEEEAKRFRENEVDGETIDCGLTENMIAFLFQGSFKKQLKFNQFVNSLKETVFTLTLEPVPPEVQQSPSGRSRLPTNFEIPSFPVNVQNKLNNKEPCHRNSKDRHVIVRVLYEAMAQFTMYPTNAEYVQVVKRLIGKYPFLKDIEGNGYQTWHMSLKRKFKMERVPLVQCDEVQQFKRKFGHQNSKKSCGSASVATKRQHMEPIALAEDATSIDAHVKILNSQYQKMIPDHAIVRDRMQQTFVWRQKEIAEGMSVEETMKKYPFLSTTNGLTDELERIHPEVKNLSKKFKEELKFISAKVLEQTRGKASIFAHYQDAKDESLTENAQDIDLRATAIFMPIFFKEKINHFITLGEQDPKHPYPSIQLLEGDWKKAFATRVPTVVKVDSVEVCRCSGIEDGVISAFCTYFIFNIQYPHCLKNTLNFLQRYIAKISLEGDQPLPITVSRKINLLY
uniref:Sterile alpha motif domain-containing protein 3-like n=1 Tax=Neogobius melanostomus TaxID=47308 RepID=A0A8C6S6A6_9GOBI